MSFTQIAGTIRYDGRYHGVCCLLDFRRGDIRTGNGNYQSIGFLILPIRNITVSCGKQKHEMTPDCPLIPDGWQVSFTNTGHFLQSQEERDTFRDPG